MRRPLCLPFIFGLLAIASACSNTTSIANNNSPFKSSNSPFKASSSPTPDVFRHDSAHTENGNASQRDNESSGKSVERMLAEMDSIYADDKPVLSDEDVRIKRIRYLLKNISTKTGDSTHDVADLTSRYTTMSRNEYGRVIKNQDWMEYANAMLSKTYPKMKWNYKTVCSLVSLDLNKE
jgi:hypothetical protein